MPSWDGSFYLAEEQRPIIITDYVRECQETNSCSQAYFVNICEVTSCYGILPESSVVRLAILGVMIRVTWWNRVAALTFSTAIGAPISVRCSMIGHRPLSPPGISPVSVAPAVEAVVADSKLCRGSTGSGGRIPCVVAVKE